MNKYNERNTETRVGKVMAPSELSSKSESIGLEGTKNKNKSLEWNLTIFL